MLTGEKAAEITAEHRSASEEKTMKVVILAGGFGSRISEGSDLKPKPMVEIGDKPILWHIMKYTIHHSDSTISSYVSDTCSTW